MKASALLILAACIQLLATLPTLAQRPQMSLDVRRKMETDTEESISRYSSTKEQDRSMTLNIMVRNNDPKDQTVTLSWYFIGNPLMAGLENFVYDKGESPLTVTARSLTNLTQVSKKLESKTAYSRTSSKKQGAKPLGYIVTLSHESNVFAVVASPSSFERLARDPAKFKEFLVTSPPVDL